MMPEPTTAARSSAVPTASAAADLIHLFLQRQALELLYGQREEKVDASAELNQRLLERTTLVLVAALNRRRVRYAPMRADRAPRPDRAHLRSRRIANGEDEIDLGSGGPNELVPALGARIAQRQSTSFEQLQRERIHFAGRMAARAVGAEAAAAGAVEIALSQDRPRGVSGTEKEHVLHRFRDIAIAVCGQVSRNCAVARTSAGKASRSTVAKPSRLK